MSRPVWFGWNIIEEIYCTKAWYLSGRMHSQSSENGLLKSDENYEWIEWQYSIGVNMDWEKWGKVRETTFRELTPTSRVRTNASKIPHVHTCYHTL